MLCRTMYHLARRTICENRRIFHTFGILSKFDSQHCNLYLNKSYLQGNLNLMISKRFKSKKKAAAEIEDEDSEDESDLEIDDYIQTKNSRIINTTVTGLRLDVIAKTGLGISRAKIDKAFYNSNIRVNGERRFKKSAPVDVEDEIDLITGRSPNNSDFLIVHRCILLSAKGTSEGISVKIVRNRSLLIEDYKDPWNGVTDDK